MTKVKLDLYYDMTNSSPKFQVNISKDGREKTEIYLSTANGAQYARREHFKRLFLYKTFLKITH